jgi:post-segregation antitoxin (ccd killing protein)
MSKRAKAKTAIYKSALMTKIKPTTHEELRNLAEKRGENVSMVVRTAINAELERSRKSDE